MMKTFADLKLPGAPVLAWVAALAAFVLLIGAGAAQIDTLVTATPEPVRQMPVSNDPYGCYELEFLAEDPACALPRAPLPEPGPMAAIAAASFNAGS